MPLVIEETTIEPPLWNELQLEAARSAPTFSPVSTPPATSSRMSGRNKILFTAILLAVLGFMVFSYLVISSSAGHSNVL